MSVVIIKKFLVYLNKQQLSLLTLNSEIPIVWPSGFLAVEIRSLSKFGNM